MRDPARRLLTEPFHRRTWKETAYALIALPVSLTWFVVLVAMLSFGAGLVFTLVGVPIIVLTLHAARFADNADRRLARTLLDSDVPLSPRAREGGDSGVVRRMVCELRDRENWRALGCVLARLPVDTALFAVTVTLWTTAITWLSAPVWYAALPSDGRPHVLGGPDRVTSGWHWAGLLLGGAALAAITPWVVRALLRLRMPLVGR
jgi:hypothetical protein